MFVAKIPTRLHGTNFCTSLTRFTLSVVTQPNSPKCTQIIRNTPKHLFRVQWCGSGVFVAKIPTRLRGTNFCTSLTPFALSAVWQPKSPKCTQIVRNAPKRQFRVQLGGSGMFVAKMHPNSMKRTKKSFWGPTGCRGTNILH